MPFDGSGNYVTLSSPTFPAVSGDLIQASYYNAVINDIATALSNAICKDGQSIILGDLDLNGHKLTDIADAVSSQDATSYLQVQNMLTAHKEKLSANRTYYVRTDGSDSNNGLANTAGGAFLTIQKAVDTAYSLDCNKFVVTIQVAAGTYTGPVRVCGKLLHGFDNSNQPFRIVGNSGSPSTVVINPTSANAIYANDGAYVLLDGLTIQTTTSGIGLAPTHGAIIEHKNCILGACATETIHPNYGAVVRAIGPTTVTGGSGSFVHATNRTLVDFNNQTLTFSGSPVFTTYLWGLNDSSVHLDDATIVGTVTGGTTVHVGGLLNVSGLTGSYLGGSAPQVDDGGIIIASDLILNRTFYVRTDGSDTNDGLANTAGRAFLTIQAAIVAVAKRAYNPRTWGGYHPYSDNCTIQIANGTYNETVYLYDLPGYMGCTLKGDETTPSNVVINGISDCLIAIGNHKPWALKGLKLTAAAGSCIRASQGSLITFQNLNFGSATGFQIQADDSAKVIKTGNYTISAGATSHVRSRNGYVYLDSVTITLTGTPAFSSAFIYLEDLAAVRIPSATFTGSATGKRYDIRTLSCVSTNSGSATYLPGDVAGSSASGAQYT